MSTGRIKNEQLKSKIMSAHDAASLIQDGMIVSASGFGKAGESKAVLNAFAAIAREHPRKITLLTGASIGFGDDTHLAEAHALKKRLPFQADPVIRKSINNGEIMFQDMHLSESMDLQQNFHYPESDFGIVEAAAIEADGSLVLTSTVANIPSIINDSKQLIIEVNEAFPETVKGLHDIFVQQPYPDKKIIPIRHPADRVGDPVMAMDIRKVAAIVLTHQYDIPVGLSEDNEITLKISGHLNRFFHEEIRKGQLPPTLMPLQAGVGNIANAVLNGLISGGFKDLTLYAEIIQDSVMHLLKAGVLQVASGAALVLGATLQKEFLNNLDFYRDRIVLRPQNVSNSGEVIKRLGVIGINTAIECDIYGNVNSTHIGGTTIMNGIGGSADYSRNCFISIFVCPSVSKAGAVSNIVPMVSHVDSITQDVDILITECGLADLRGKAPRERAELIIRNCANPLYKEALLGYFNKACERGGNTPHLIESALSWHARLREKGTMLPE